MGEAARIAGLPASSEAALRRAAEHAIRFRHGVAARPIGPAEDYDTQLGRFGGPVPESGKPPVEVIDELVAMADPGLLAIPNPRFFGWVVGASHPVGVAADWLTSAWGQNAAMALSTPAAAAAEETAGRWMLDLLDLPRDAGFGFTTGATMANAIGLAAARNALLGQSGWDVEAKGLFGAPEVNVVLGEEAHSTVFMGLRLIGFGAERVIRVAADGQGRMIAGALSEALRPLNGPTIVIAQAGHINSGAFDPFGPTIKASRAHGAWVHVDGAFGLWARACPDCSALAAGVEGADSWATDGHKWLQTPYDGGFVFVRDQAALQRSMSLTASYLPHSADLRDPGDYTPELSRRARGFAVWAVLRALGRTGVAEMVGRRCRVARRIAKRLAAEPGIRIVNEVVLNQVAVAFGPEDDADRADAATRETLARIQREGICYPSHGVWHGRAIMRISVSAHSTDNAEGDYAAEAVIAAWRTVRGEMA
ncbi:MAG TPA: pyridoxal-dependent decarboxylase [Thermohalobaculum sp.]|nr:pyridoxal-dependent decarboxylase [Thermohalobaculum sp.]